MIIFFIFSGFGQGRFAKAASYCQGPLLLSQSWGENQGSWRSLYLDCSVTLYIVPSIAFIWSDVNSYNNIFNLSKIISEKIIIETMSIPDKNWQPPTVSLDTSMGEVVVELYWKQAPLTCRNFAELARRGYYNDTKFHRIIKVRIIEGIT